MIRYLAILLAASLACLVLWLPAGHTATQFYQAARGDHAACSALWGASFATTALSSALAAAAVERPASTPAVTAPGPTGPAERRLAGQMQDIARRFYGMHYMRSVEAMTTLACYRLATMLYLAPGLALLLIAALMDAAMRRTIRTHEFRRHDPERYAFGIAGAMLASGALLATCVLPVPMPPQLPPGAMLLAIYCLHVALANFHHSGN